MLSEVKGTVLMNNASVFETIIKHSEKLPTLPGIAMKILEAVQKKDSDLKEIADIIATDPPLSAEVLKIINSPFYGLPSKITSVFHGVNMMGLHTVKNLALSFSLIKKFRHSETRGFDYTDFWKISLTAATASKFMARNINSDLAEDAFFLGLLHNIGILAMIQTMPDQYRLVLSEMAGGDYTFEEAENQILGFNHMAVGEYLVKSWGLPEIFSVPIAHHHDPATLIDPCPEVLTLTRVLHLATLFVNLFQSSDKTVRLGLIEHYAEAYGWIDRISIDETAQKIQQSTREIFPFFEIDLKDQEDYTTMLETARKELINLSSGVMNTLLQQKKQIQVLREQISRDAMTQLINYQRFYELLHQEI